MRIARRQCYSTSSMPAVIECKSVLDGPRKTFIDSVVCRDNLYWQNRVTLKFDVPFTDHSHIIGRGGNNTKEVMKLTGCHIHFPDSNKNHDGEKSNQVSISGAIDKVEVARSRIRGLAPLSVSFELKGVHPSVNVDKLVADAALEKTFGFEQLNIVVRTNRTSGQPYCLVRGSAHQQHVMIDACRLLHSTMFPPEYPVQYSTSLEVLPAQQSAVIGPGGGHMQWIVRQTGATVHYPSETDCQRGASTFYIAGPINAIIAARKYILGLLPVQLSFSVRKESGRCMPQQDVSTVEKDLGVSIIVKQERSVGGNGERDHGGGKTVTARSLEYNLSNVYAVRQRLIDGAEEGALCNDYDFMHAIRSMVDPATMIGAFCSSTGPISPAISVQLPSPFSAMSLPPVSPFMQSPSMIFGAGFPSFFMQTAYIPQQHSPMSPSQASLPTLPPSVSSQYSTRPLQQPLPKPWLMERGRVDSRSTGLGSSVSSERSSPPDVESDHSTDESTVVPSSTLLLSPVGGIDSMHQKPPLTPKTSPISPNPQDSPIAHSLLAGAKNINQQMEKDQLNSVAWKAPGAGRPPRDLLRMMANMAMTERPSEGVVRTPTAQWSGLHFSNSMPAERLKSSMQQQRTANCTDMSSSGGGSMLPSLFEDENRLDFAATSYFDAPAMDIDWNIDNFGDVSMVLAALGLNEYWRQFREQEIDMEAFLLLDEQNLKDLGVTTMGARKKLRIAIFKLNESAERRKY